MAQDVGRVENFSGDSFISYPPEPRSPVKMHLPIEYEAVFDVSPQSWVRISCWDLSDQILEQGHYTDVCPQLDLAAELRLMSYLAFSRLDPNTKSSDSPDMFFNASLQKPSEFVIGRDLDPLGDVYGDPRIVVFSFETGLKPKKRLAWDQKYTMDVVLSDDHSFSTSVQTPNKHTYSRIKEAVDEIHEMYDMPGPGSRAAARLLVSEGLFVDAIIELEALPDAEKKVETHRNLGDLYLLIGNGQKAYGAYVAAFEALDPGEVTLETGYLYNAIGRLDVQFGGGTNESFLEKATKIYLENNYADWAPTVRP
ncbi:MAG: hypothetical protein OEU36_19155 [Gammaproteobacteria bacterium]|nr:hypothetical protein [Gammaproteobacteria bacterium]